jgi:DNA phosphorothioation-associated putative methyltransferase
MSALPIGPQRDIRASFGSYANGCRRADELRFRAGDADAVDDACRRSAVGKLLPDALYIHRTALEALDPLLRVYEGCSRAYLGEIEGANLIKLHRQSGKVSYLTYPDFDADPHPALWRSIQLNLRTREIESSDYATSPNPPILHRKEAFLLPDDPRRAKFDHLTRQEERAGLLDEPATIGTRSGWADRLPDRGYALRGHRLVKTRTEDEGAGT